MRFYEFASDEDKLDLWRVIDQSVWQALDAEANQSLAKDQVIAPRKPTALTKGDFKKRGIQVASANARDQINPNAHASEKLHQAQQQQIQQNYQNSTQAEDTDLSHK